MLCCIADGDRCKLALKLHVELRNVLRTVL